MKIIIGTANFGNKYGLSYKKNISSRKELKNLFKTSIRNKINLLDTSINYNHKKEIYDPNIFRKFHIISKISFTEKEKKNKEIDEIFLKKIFEIRKRYKIKNFYGILFHNVDDLAFFDKDKLKRKIEYLKKEKICSKFGASVYEPLDLKKVLVRLKPEIIQLPLNILDDRFFKSGWIKKLKSMNVEIHARSLFLQSLLLIDYKEILKNFYNINILRKFENHRKLKKISKLDMCINHIKNFKQISHIVVGVQNSSQLKTIIKSLKKKKFKTTFKVSKISRKIIDPRLW